MSIERIEIWSLPWHVLQRSLANDVAPLAQPSAAPGVTATAQATTTAAPAAPVSLSWLARARAPVHFVARRGR
jgi:hypothetical protein